MSWYRVTDGRLAFRGRITREAFASWLETSEGAATLEAAARHLRLRFLARARASRRLWQDLDRLVRTGTLRRALQEEASHFAVAVSGLCYAPALPRTQVALHRLVVVPRTMIAGLARNRVRLRLWHSGLSPLPDAVRAFFCEQILVEMDTAIRSVQPSVATPVAMDESWVCVASDPDYTWVDPLWSGRRWTGHLVMFEMPRTTLSRAQRKELERAVVSLQKGLEAIGRLQRQSIVRTAVDGLPA
jgi:hypothetical protein